LKASHSVAERGPLSVRCFARRFGRLLSGEMSSLAETNDETDVTLQNHRLAGPTVLRGNAGVRETLIAQTDLWIKSVAIVVGFIRLLKEKVDARQLRRRSSRKTHGRFPQQSQQRVR